MTTPNIQAAYGVGTGTSPIPAFVFRDRDPTSNDIDPTYKLYMGWVNTNTKAIWFLESLSASNGVITATWRAVGPIVTSTSSPTSADYLYPLGQSWVDTTLNDYWVLVAVVGTVATWVKVSAGGGNGIDSITGNTGGPVFGDTNNNVNFIGNTLYDVDGNPGTNSLAINPRVNAYPMTPFVVGAVGQAGYQTIQDAMDAADAQGGGYVSILPGVYNETLTAYNNVHLIAYGNQNGPTVIINGGITVNTAAGNIGFYMQGVRVTGVGQEAILISGANDVELSMMTCQINAETQDGINCSSPGLVFINNCSINASAGQKNLDITGDVQIRLYNTFVESVDTASTINSSSFISIAFSSLISDSFDITSGVVSIANSGVGTISTLPLFKLRTSGVGALSNCIVTANTSATFLVDGDGPGSSGAFLYFSTGPNPGQTFTIDPDVNQLPVNEYPFSTAGTTGTAVRGSAAFDSDFFTVTDGFVTLSSSSSGTTNVIVFTANGNYTPTAGMDRCIIECVGGGAGGGGTNGGNGAAAGGSSGGYSKAMFTAATIGASQSVTIGAFGAGGAAGSNSGANGGATSVGALITANGGNGGAFGGANGSGGAGISPGATVGTVAGSLNGYSVITGGNPGMYGMTITTSFSGNGGSTLYGGGGAGINAFAGTTAGGNATGYGAGGGGACSNGGGGASAGGNGSPGIVIITEFI